MKPVTAPEAGRTPAWPRPPGQMKLPPGRPKTFFAAPDGRLFRRDFLFLRVHPRLKPRVIFTHTPGGHRGGLEQVDRAQVHTFIPEDSRLAFSGSAGVAKWQTHRT